ncbi:hypothetical protein OJ252_2498 [Cryptosporidium canis]|uniref:Uncharacterized protein n=1 Tax=Cryptosporidium canis TaxID=195482 RepID=A0ABQ8P517_9CRYT|nr:hypothetical protein OJ252_2498 [Cryptosporidium canis]
MIDPASAFCIGVYFLGVGVVGSVLYIPVSLMRAIEHHRLRKDEDKNRGSDSHDGDLPLYYYGNTMNNGDRSARNSKSQSLCDDGSSLFFEKPELLLIHKKKVLRDILNDNNYLSNFIDLDERSDHSFGACERFTTCQNSVGYNSSMNKSKSEIGSSRKCLANYPQSIMYDHVDEASVVEFSRDILSTTTPSDKDESDEHPETAVYEDGKFLSARQYTQIGGRKEHIGHIINHKMCTTTSSSTNSTSSIASCCDIESSRSIHIMRKKNYCIAKHKSLLNSFFASQAPTRVVDVRGRSSWGASFGHSLVDENKELMVVSEISAAHDILAP